MKIVKSIAIMLVVYGMIFSVGGVLKAYNLPNVMVVLDGQKKIDSSPIKRPPINPMEDCFTLSLSCVAHSKHPMMGVLRGSENIGGIGGVWLSGTALKCAKGCRTSKKYNVHQYAKNHGIVSYTNFISIRLYGNHCDDQKRGTYGNGIAQNCR